jgi:hypothetical protein
VKSWLVLLKVSILLATLALLAACAPAATPAIPAPTQAISPPTEAPPPTAAPSPTPFIEERLVEVEWPSHLRLGESDVLRLSLVPSGEGYVAQAEFEEHPIATQAAPIRHVPGYTLLGIARLDGVGFDISPSGEQRRIITPGEVMTWRWTLAAHKPGKHRLTVNLTLRWEPETGVTGPVSESLAYGRGLDVQVESILGMTQPQAVTASLFGLLFGVGLGGFALIYRRQPQAPRGLQRGAALRQETPNPRLAIELGPSIHLAAEEQRLTQALFSRYSRVLVEGEFRSGYSGARALLVRPVSADGRADAETIAKMGPRRTIQAEYENYERYVKDRLPPITARIQHPPVAVPGGNLAALQYTFISEPGHTPLSLRQALLDRPDPSYLQLLFQTFGPNWWMQRQAYTFRLETEYDDLLPPHWILGPALSGAMPSGSHGLKTGEAVRLGRIEGLELRPDGKSWTLRVELEPGQPPIRVRWLSAQPPEAGRLAQVVESRSELLRRWTASFERFDLPDPLEELERWLATTVQGTRSTIHGDLNLENILVGPGELVWLIDFARTREGHPLFDFAHLGAEIVAHVLAVGCSTPQAYLERLTAGDELLQALEEIASRCMFDPKQREEYRLPLIVACLGALKYANLAPQAKHCLYLTAAFQAAAE